jgi:hypothetical protein
MLCLGCDSVLCALCAAVRDEPWRPLPGRGGRHRPAGHAGAGLDQSLPSRLAEQGMSSPFLFLVSFLDCVANKQGCGSGSAWIRLIFGSWIRIRMRIREKIWIEI